jgi:hypothetical protein
MDNKERKNSERVFQECNFPFGKFDKMAEMMKSCCTGEDGMADCCSMMRKMMNQEEREEKKETEGPLKDGSCV